MDKVNIVIETFDILLNVLSSLKFRLSSVLNGRRIMIKKIKTPDNRKKILLKFSPLIVLKLICRASLKVLSPNIIIGKTMNSFTNRYMITRPAVNNNILIPRKL